MRIVASWANALPLLLPVIAVVPAVAPTPARAQTLDAPVRYDTDLPSVDFHGSRREAVLEALPDGALAIVFGAPRRNRSNDVWYEYRQSSDLLYLTGSHEPGSVLLLAPGGMDVDGRRVRELLFVPPRDPDQEVWLGRRFGAERAMAVLGIDLAVDATRFAEVAGPLLSELHVFHLPLPDAVPGGSLLHGQLTVFSELVTTDVGDDPPGPDASRLRAILDDLRTVKTDEELQLLRRAIDITAEAHRAVMQELEPGWHEYEIEALVEYTFKRRGAEHAGFPSIVGSGENSVILHYETNRRRVEAGDVVVIDIGAELHGYAADLTRTLPADGRFSAEQRAVYELVYRAQEAGIDAARAGNPFSAPHSAARGVLAEGLSALGLIDGPDDEAGLRRFFMHGTSHYLGLDVHDVGSRGPLRPGAVLTVEPGVYIPAADDIEPRWWNIGVRIEDDILVTEDAPVVLSAGVPRQVDAVETLMRQRPGR